MRLLYSRNLGKRISHEWIMLINIELGRHTGWDPPGGNQATETGNGDAGSLDILLEIEWLQCPRDVFQWCIPPLAPFPFFLLSIVSGDSVYNNEFSAFYFAISECCGSVLPKLWGRSTNLSPVSHTILDLHDISW